jgi:hypothetical protein
MGIKHAHQTVIVDDPLADVSADEWNAAHSIDAPIAVADGGTGAATAAAAATALGVGTGDSPQHAGINLGHASDTTLGRTSAGVMNVEGKDVYMVGGADVAVADGGTGAGTAGGAATNLGLGTGDTPTFTGVNVGNADTTVTRLAAGSLAVEGVPIKLGSMFVPAAAMTPSTTSGCKAPTLHESATNKQNKWFLDFIDGSTTFAEWLSAMPADYDGGTFTAVFYWSNANTTGNVVRWQIEARSYGDLETYDQAFGTAQTVDDTYSTTAHQVAISAATGACTPSGTPAANELMHFRAARVGGNAADTLTTDARLIGVRINYTRT